MPDQPQLSLTTKVLNSLGWVFTNIVSKNLLQFVRTVILWRILSEFDFGLNGMAWLAINAFTLLQDMGFASALIQRKKDIEEAISITWYANVVIRVVLYGVLFIMAPIIAGHFDEGEVGPILRVAGLCILIGAFGNANEAVLRKNFQFKLLLVIDALELFCQCALQILLAWLGYGVWSLVFGSVVGALARSLLLWWLAPIRLGRFNIAVAKEMFHFGKHMTGSTLLIWLIMNMDYYFVGKFLGTAALGFYTLAFKLSQLMATNVGRALASVLYPAFAEIGGGDMTRMRGAWLRAVRYTMITLTPLGVALIVFAPEIVRGFFPPKCDIVIAPMALLTVFGLSRGVGVTLGDLVKGIGRPEILTRVAFCQCVGLLPVLLAAVMLAPDVASGLVRTSIGVSSIALLANLLHFYLAARVVHFKAREVVVALLPPLSAGLAAFIVAVLAKMLLAACWPLSPFVVLAVVGLLAVLVYGGVLWFGFAEVFEDLRRMLARRRAERGAQAALKKEAPVAREA